MATLAQAITAARAASTEFDGYAVAQQYDLMAGWFAVRPTIPNPDPQPNVREPFESMLEIAGLMNQQDVAIFLQGISLIDSQATVGGILNIKRSPTPAEFLTYLVGKGLSSEGQSAILNRYNKQYPDPSWPPEILGDAGWETYGLTQAPTASDVQSFFNQ